MGRLPRFSLLALLILVSRVDGEAFSVRISTENHVNEVDTRFVSFTIDPKHLFTSSDDLSSKDSTCMAASLTPAFLRIAGPSTSHITFNNKSMSIDQLDDILPEPTKQKRHLIRKKTDESSYDDEYRYDSESQEDLLTRLRKSSQKLLKRHRRQIFDSQEFKTNGNEESEEKIHPKFKKSKIHDALAKYKKVQDTDDNDGKLIKSLEEEESQESIFSKLKKSRRGLKKLKEEKDAPKRLRRLSKDHLEVSHRQWKSFAKWANYTGFSLVFAVNNGEKTDKGMWDPNPALNMLTIADKDDVQEIFWQLGYECNNQTLEDYLNDLQTLRMMVDTFSARKWKVVGGDVSGCLQAGSKSDFKDYVTLSADDLDAVLLNGNSSSHELARMSNSDRLSLLRVLSTSNALWLTEHPQQHSEQARAADWLTSLGYSARNGFHVHFRELTDTELHEPTLSFYMALLFKNLVGERVLDVTIEPSDGQAALFAHCTSLRHKPVPGAVTLYGVNMDTEPARFSIKLAKREEGGDIMQFILGHDHSGNIVVNGRPMFYEGNIRPVVKRVRPFKTLLLNLPPKTFGFWVLANTKINACYDDDKGNVTFVEAKPVKNEESEETKVDPFSGDEKKKKDGKDSLKSTEEVTDDDNKSEPSRKTKTLNRKPNKNNENDIESMDQQNSNNDKITLIKKSSEEGSKNNEEDYDSQETVRSKRSLDLDNFGFNGAFIELNDMDNDEALRSRIDTMNRSLRDVQGLIEIKDHLLSNRVKRQFSGEEYDNKKKTRRQLIKKAARKLKQEHKFLGSGIFEKLMNNINGIQIPKLNLTKSLKERKYRKLPKHSISKISKRNSRNYRNREDIGDTDEEESLSRKKRSLLVNNKTYDEDKTKENEIDLDDKKQSRFRKFLKKHKEMQEAIHKNDKSDYDNDEQKSSKHNDGIEINTKLTDDDAEFKISENADHGLLKSAFDNVLSLLEELNDKLSRVWTALSFLD